MATYTEDFGSYPAGQWDPTTGPWEHSADSTTPTTHLAITEDPCVPGGQYLKFTKPVGSTPSLRLNNTDADESSLEGDSLLMWRFPTIQSGTTGMPYAIQRSWLDVGNDLYGSFIRLVQGSIDRYSVNVWDNGSSSSRVADAGSVSLSPDTWYLTRSNFQNNGDGTYTFRARTWEWGTTEPATWDVDETAGNLDWDSGNNPNEQAGGFGLFSSMSTSIADGDSFDIAFVSWSDDPDSAAPEATTALEDFHDVTTEAQIDTDESFVHAQGALSDGLAVLRIVLRNNNVIAPTYDGSPMTQAVSQANDNLNGRVDIWYALLGSSGAGNKTVDLGGGGSGFGDIAVSLSTYNNIDQTDPVYDFGSAKSDGTDEDTIGGHLDSHVYGDLVVDAAAFVGDLSPSEDCPYLHRVDDLSGPGSHPDLDAQDVVSSTAATPMFWDRQTGLTTTGAWVGVTFASKVTRIQSTLAVPLENNLTIEAVFGISVENLVTDDPSLFSRYRLFVEMGPSTRTLDIDV